MRPSLQDLKLIYLSFQLAVAHCLLTSREVIIVQHTTSILLHPSYSTQNLLSIEDGKCQTKDIQSCCGQKDQLYRHASQTLSIMLTLMLKQKIFNFWVNLYCAIDIFVTMFIWYLDFARYQHSFTKKIPVHFQDQMTKFQDDN